MSHANFLAGPLELPPSPPSDDGPRRGDIYEKRSHTKTAVNAPRIRIAWTTDKMVGAVAKNFTGYGFVHGERTMRITTLNAEWRKVPQ